MKDDDKVVRTQEKRNDCLEKKDQEDEEQEEEKGEAGGEEREVEGGGGRHAGGGDDQEEEEQAQREKRKAEDNEIEQERIEGQAASFGDGLAIQVAWDDVRGGWLDREEGRESRHKVSDDDKCGAGKNLGIFCRSPSAR